MTVCAEAVELIKRHEGVRLVAYLCPACVWTIGYGHTGDVKQGDRITQHQAEVLLSYDLERFDRAVAELAPGLNPNQHGALVSFAYNVGVEALRKSGLLKHVLAGRHQHAALAFGAWVHARNKEGKHVKLPGLVKRRAEEAALYLRAP